MMRKSKILLFLILAITVLSFVSSVAIASEYQSYPYSSNPFSDYSGMTGAGFLCIIIAIIPMIIGALIGVWIYKDAQKRGEEGKAGLVLAIIVVLVSVFLGFTGLGISIVIAIIWLVIRDQNVLGSNQYQYQQVDRRCPNCGRPIPFDSIICPYCGNNFRNNL